MKFKNTIIIIVTIGLFSSMINFIASAEEPINEPLHRQLDFDEDTSDWVYEEPDTSTGTSVILWENFGGFWADAEKAPNNIPPYNDEDDLLCWSATCSNMLEWTGWGFVPGMDYGNTDTFFAYYQDHTTDKGSLNEHGLEWWFTGFLNDHGDPANWSSEDVPGADFWSLSYTWTDYVLIDWTNTQIPQNIDSWINSGYPVGFAIYPINPPGGHAITCWGYNYDSDGATPEDYYLGVWVTDSDSHKHLTDPDDVIRYYELDYWDNNTGDTSDDYWYMPNYGNGWRIGGVCALKPFPGETRPVADAGGPYNVNEGTAVSFDASGSSDDDTLEYRWDFDADGTWDTLWSTIPTVSHTWNDNYYGDVYLEVFDGRLKDIDITTITVQNVAPSITINSDTIDENGIATISGTITDPGVLDTFSVSIYWGEGSPENFGYSAGSTSYSETHQYLDDDPSVTSSDVYSVSITVTDDDGGSDSEISSVTVNNVAPTINAGLDQTVNEGDTVYFTSSISDPGTLDTHTYLWDFDDGSGTSMGSSPTYIYGDDGDFDVSLTVTDDDSGSDTDTVNIQVLNVAPIISKPISMVLPYPGNPGFILPVVHNLEFSATAEDPGSDDLNFIWDWGDSTTVTETIYYNDGVSDDPYPSPEINPVNITDTVYHTYADPGTYIVILTVTDDDGGSVVDTYTVVVLDIEAAKHDINDYIQDLPDSYFRGNADNRKNAFDSMFYALDDMLDDEEYWGMIQHLNNNIREKCDGTVDGKTSNDWIKNPDAQYHICAKIDDLTAYIETYL